MGLLSSFDTNRDQFNNSGVSGKLVVNLSDFIVSGTPIGNAPWNGDFFTELLSQKETLKSDQDGYELSTTKGVLTSAFITLEDFAGSFLIKSQLTPLSIHTTKEEITTLFGEPYWTDRDDGEIILFYEYRAGGIELQFEFPDGQPLGFITLMKDGILSVANQRKSYGVTKPWPPEES